MTSKTLFRITATKGDRVGQFSSGSTCPKFKTTGKIWAERSHVLAHLSQLRSDGIDVYRTHGATIEEFIPQVQETLKIVEFLDITNAESLLNSAEEYFLKGTISSAFFWALITEDLTLQNERKLKWNRKKPLKIGVDLSELLPHHCFGKAAASWVGHDGYVGSPEETKAMLSLEHDESLDFIDQWMKSVSQK